VVTAQRLDKCLAATDGQFVGLDATESHAPLIVKSMANHHPALGGRIASA